MRKTTIGAPSLWHVVIAFCALSRGNWQPRRDFNGATPTAWAASGLQAQAAMPTPSLALSSVADIEVLERLYTMRAIAVRDRRPVVPPRFGAPLQYDIRDDGNAQAPWCDTCKVGVP